MDRKLCVVLFALFRAQWCSAATPATRLLGLPALCRAGGIPESIELLGGFWPGAGNKEHVVIDHGNGKPMLGGFKPKMLMNFGGLPCAGNEEHVVVDHDDGIHPEFTKERLARYKPVFQKTGTTTVCNASQVSWGPALLLLLLLAAVVVAVVVPVGRAGSFTSQWGNSVAAGAASWLRTQLCCIAAGQPCGRLGSKLAWRHPSHGLAAIDGGEGRLMELRAKRWPESMPRL